MARGATTNLPREAILAAGAFTALGTGAIYMWSIFNKPLMEEFGFTTSEVSMIYSLFLLASCFSSMLAGWLQRHTQPRFIVLGAGVLFGLGWFCSGPSCCSLAWARWSTRWIPSRWSLRP